MYNPPYPSILQSCCRLSKLQILNCRGELYGENFDLASYLTENK